MEWDESSQMKENMSKLPADTQVEESAEDTLTPQQNRRLFWKTNAVVLTILVLAMLMGFLDKNAMSYAAVYGIVKDTNLKGQEYSWLGSIFYFGYLAMEVPALWVLTKVRIGKFLGCILVLWGITICCMAAGKNFGTLATARFFLGIFEASLLPACIVLTSVWYRREEHAIVSAFYYNTFAGIFGGILAYAIGHIQGSLASWKYLFVIYGAVTIALGVIVLLALPDSPNKAWFFTAEEKNLIVIRTAENQTGQHHADSMKWGQILEAVLDPKFWIIGVGVMAYAVTNAGITNFTPLVISGYGFSQSKTVLMAAPQAAVAMVSQIIATIIMFYVPNVRCLLWLLSTFPAIAGGAMVHVLDINTQKDASLAGVYLMGFYNVPFVTMLSLQSSNNAGATKKSFVSVSFAVFYAVANIFGPQFFRSDQAPYYPLGMGAMLVAFCIMAVMAILYFVCCLIENKRRDSKYGKPSHLVAAGMEADSEDKSDKENHNFRYTY